MNDNESPLTPSPSSAPPPTWQPTPSSGRWSGLAIASFITGLLCVPLASVVCGHLALGQFKRDPDMQGKWMAIVGLVLGYLMILAMVLAIVIGMMSVALRMQTQQSSPRAVTRTARVDSRSSDATQHHKSGHAPEPPASSEIPDSPISGSIEGVPLAIQRAKISGGNLEFRSGTSGFSSDQWIMIFLFAGNDPLEGQSWVIPGGNEQSKAHVHLHWKEGGKKLSKAMAGNFTFRLEFGASTNGTLPGKIYFVSGRKHPGLEKECEVERG